MHSDSKRIFVTVLASGLLSSLCAVVLWQQQDAIRFTVYLVAAVLTSPLRVPLPGLSGTLSLNFIFLLTGVVEFSLGEMALMAVIATFAQCCWNPPAKPSSLQLAFNLANAVNTVTCAYAYYHALAVLDLPLRLLGVGAVYFFANTFPVAVIIAKTEDRAVREVWREAFSWSLPYYLCGAGIAGALSASTRSLSWQGLMLTLLLVYATYRCYGFYLNRADADRLGAVEMSQLHQRTIEALAMAVDAKDHTAPERLLHIQLYALDLGRHLGLRTGELEALRTAALLHDIGKLAVPEHILSKPDKLSREEFEKLKIHPLVGAEILERVRFPYPVVPIVRAHHEKWNGGGYPDGLRGEAIPIGARILAVVDCYLEMTLERQYHRAVPVELAMDRIQEESGISFDPRVVEALVVRYKDLEARARRLKTDRHHASTPVVNGRPAPNGNEHEAGEAPASSAPKHFVASIAAARQEAQALFEITQSLGSSLSLDETLSVFTVRLKRTIPFDAIAIFVVRDNCLRPEYVTGENFRAFSNLEIPVGKGLSGWVAASKRFVLNGDPSMEPGYAEAAKNAASLRSALVVPLDGVGQVAGVLSLYHRDKDAFTRDHLRMLLAISSKVGLSIENALKYRQAESSASTDYLTGLPNARSLFLHLDGELARCRRLETPLAVLVTDLDGFKQVNDRFGHLEGNRLLTRVAQKLKENLREYDCVARMGGDEFVLVLPGQTPESIKSSLGRLREVVIAAGREVLGEPVIGLSIGEAYFPVDGDDAERLLAEADRRMYQVKNRTKLLADGGRGYDFDVSRESTMQP